MSQFWSWYVIVLTVIVILGCYWLIDFANRIPAGEAKSDKDTTGHSWDGLEELNSPLPRWWLWLFYLSIVFAFVYLALYPGLGNFPGFLGWSEVKQYDEQVSKADEKYGPIFAQYAGQAIETLSQNPEALDVGRRLFLNYCAGCHGSDAGGAPSFPNLTDNDWLYGNSPEAIKTSILDGRRGMMPPFGAALGDPGVEEAAAYVISLSGGSADPAKVEAGKTRYMTLCVGCHMPDGSGMQAVGAPKLTDNTWLYGRSPGVVMQTIREGRTGVMPAHREFLGEDKVHVLAAYVYSLSQHAQ